jgi:hypothetical protein
MLMRMALQPNVETGAVESKPEAVFLELVLSVECTQTVVLIKPHGIASYSAKFDARFVQSGASP